MSSLSLRTYKYYFIRGLKWALYMIGLQCVLVLEWVLFGVDNGGDLLSYVLNMYISCGVLLLIIVNTMFSIYGPNWYDSIVLSMGARRKDIFWGEMIKQLVFIVANALVFITVSIVFGRTESVIYIVLAAIIGFILGPVGLIVGYSIKNYGRIVVAVIAMICGIFGAIMSGFARTGYSIIKFPLITIPAVFVGAIVVFVLLEVWVYKLNKKCMVR